MKKTFHILTAALLLTAGALLTTGCGNDDTAIDNGKDQPAQGRTVMFTATLAPKGEGDNGGQTRAITVDNQGTATETLNVAWKENEKIALRYQTGPDTYATTTAYVDGEPNADGSANINATLTSPMDGGSVTFVYPASLANTKCDDIDENILLYQQNGLLNTGMKNISKNFDAATGSGIISVSAGTAVVSSKVTMTNRVCICKIQLNFSNGSNPVSSGGKTLTIAVGDGRTYTISSPRESSNQPYGQPTQYEPFETGDVIYVAMLPVVSQKVTFLSVNGSNDLFKYSSTVEKLVAGTFYRNIPLTLTQTTTANRTLTTSDGEVTLQHGDIVTGTGGENTRLKIAAGATVKLNDLDNIGITENSNIPGIECLGDATIILSGENSVRGREYAPGIFIPSGHTLTIQGSGKLDATGGNTSYTGSGSGLIGGAGIGGTKNTSCGNIVIAGGTITATGTGWCAGIGSGYADGVNVTCGAITISGGTVTATGGRWAAGIGSGNAENNTNTCGAITISGGTVTATGGRWAAGIGSGCAGNKTNTCGDITISGGTVEATGGDYAAGIGSGYANQARNTCGDITISGSAKVKAVGKTYAAGIGTGNGYDADKNGICGAISIIGGTVEATGGDRAAGIGSGYWGKFTSISIGSGITRVTATRSNNFWNVPIGKGFNDQGSGAVTFGTETMHDGTGDSRQSNWAKWPETGGPFGGIQVTASDYGSNNGRTWTLTPAP